MTPHLRGGPCLILLRQSFNDHAISLVAGRSNGPGAINAADLTGATPVTVTNAYDTADRATACGYAYDTLRRTATVPPAWRPGERR